ncbi:hypothetical protein BaRGS_00031284, partial [Batillaria attramentaria]
MAQREEKVGYSPKTTRNAILQQTSNRPCSVSDKTARKIDATTAGLAPPRGPIYSGSLVRTETGQKPGE